MATDDGELDGRGVVLGDWSLLRMFGGYECSSLENVGFGSLDYERVHNEVST